MNADGTGQRRISFGAAAYASPDWSPDGQLDRFHPARAGGRRIGVMQPDGSGERVLTSRACRRRRELGGEQPRNALPAKRPSGRSSLITGYRSTGRQPRRSPFRRAGRIRTGRERWTDAQIPRSCGARCIAASAAGAAAGPAQISDRRQQLLRQCPLTGIEALRADFLAQSGGDTVYFASDSANPRERLPKRHLPRRPVAPAASGSRGADRRLWRYRAIPAIMRWRWVPGAREEARDYLRAAGRPGGAGLDSPAGARSAPASARAVTILVQLIRRRGADSR